MFSRANKKKSNSEFSSTERAGPPTIVSQGTMMRGDISCAGELQVDGTVEGDIRAAVLTIGTDGQVTGNIVAETVFVHGSVTGDVKALTVSIAESGRVKGDVSHRHLSIEEGAFLEGHCWHVETLSLTNAAVTGASKDENTESSAAPGFVAAVA